MEWSKGEPSATTIKKAKRQCREDPGQCCEGTADVINLPLPRSQEDEATEDMMNKLEIIVDDDETLWSYPNSPTQRLQ